jgi:predicted nucleic acid-binding protein
MILADTSIWVEHFKKGSRVLAALLDSGRVLVHPWVIGELALGGVSHEALALITALPRAATAADDELLGFITRERLAGSGIGYVDTQLLASTRLTPDGRLWTADGKLRTVAERLALGYRPS